MSNTTEHWEATNEFRYITKWLTNQPDSLSHLGTRMPKSRVKVLQQKWITIAGSEGSILPKIEWLDIPNTFRNRLVVCLQH